MVIDSSAFLAILLGEPEQDRFIAAIADDPVRVMGAVTRFETSMVLLSRRGDDGLADFAAFCTRAGVTTVPYDQSDATLALDAFRRFGKGRHPAALNFGDCCSYALATATGQPLLFKGHDFPRTDVIPAA